MAQKAATIGIAVPQPKKSCTDAHCPFHGTVRVRGREHTGTVISAKMSRSAVVQWEYRHFLPKYERYEKRLSKITVHAPDCLDVKEGDMVRIAETRPLSKTKHYAVIENLGREKGYHLKAPPWKRQRREGARRWKPRKAPRTAIRKTRKIPAKRARNEAGQGEHHQGNPARRGD